MDIGARPHVFGVFLMLLMHALTLAEGLSLHGLYTLSCVGASVRRYELALSTGPKLSRFHLKTERESSFRNVVF
jgi:hypothetical protein